MVAHASPAAATDTGTVLSSASMLACVPRGTAREGHPSEQSMATVESGQPSPVIGRFVAARPSTEGRGRTAGEPCGWARAQEG